MDCQSHETEQSRVVSCKQKSVPHLYHKQITETVSSILREEKEKSKQKLIIILLNIPESEANKVDVRRAGH